MGLTPLLSRGNESPASYPRRRTTPASSTWILGTSRPVPAKLPVGKNAVTLAAVSRVSVVVATVGIGVPGGNHGPPFGVRSARR